METRYYKFICGNCGVGKLASKKDVIINIIRNSFLTIMVCLGAIFLLQLIIIGPTDIFNTYLTAGFTSSASEYSSELREIALNATTYTGRNSYLFAMDLAPAFKDIRYVPTNLYTGMGDVMETLKFGGDCKQVAALFVALMRSSGYKAFVDCNIKHNHCVAKIPYTSSTNSVSYSGTYMTIEIVGTLDRLYIYNNSVNHWEDKDNYLETMEIY